MFWFASLNIHNKHIQDRYDAASLFLHLKKKLNQYVPCCSIPHTSLLHINAIKYICNIKPTYNISINLYTLFQRQLLKCLVY